MQVDRLDDDVVTPLACALRAGHVDVAISLLRQGASLGLMNEAGDSAVRFSLICNMS